MENRYVVQENATATAYAGLDNPTVQKLWKSFQLNRGSLRVSPVEDYVFRLGDAPLPTLTPGREFALAVGAQGVAIVGADFGGLMRGFFSFLLKLEYENGRTLVAYTAEESTYRLACRMIHLCVFPEDSLYTIKKRVRLAALCQYTHVIFEFWGMLRLDCLAELAWPQAFTKEQALELIEECRRLGMEPVPMHNQLGHASGARFSIGKHVVLDQNPALQELFTPAGWDWDISSERVVKLLENIRRELYELFGEGEYIHVGCDEAFYIARCERLRQELPDYLRRLTAQVEREGRRPMLWMDMLLENKESPNSFAGGDSSDWVKKLRAAVAPSAVFVDWQYERTEAPIPSLETLKDCGHDCIGAAWYGERNCAAHIETLSRLGMLGFMLTTWHTLSMHTPSILKAAKLLGAKTLPWSELAFFSAEDETALLLRRVSFEGNGYADCGWAKQQIKTEGFYR